MIEVIGKIEQSLQMKRFIKAAKTYERYATIEKRAARLKRKWLKKVKYYQKLFST